MTAARDKVTRFSADLVDAAAAEGERQSRSARQQLDHWVRVGRAVTSYESGPRRRVQAALSGELEMNELDVPEAVAFNAEIQASIEERLAVTDFGERLAAEGVTTVALDERGRLVEYRPDGTARRLTTKRASA